MVLRSPPDLGEDELDHRLEVEARALGVQFSPSTSPQAHLTPSISTMTIASDSENPSSAISLSTFRTSCSSSERRHTFQSRMSISPSQTSSVAPSIYSFTELKASAFRNGIRRMSVFRKRKSAPWSRNITPTGTDQVFGAVSADQYSAKESMESPLSVRSSKSSWSTSIPPVRKGTLAHPTLDDPDSIPPIKQCPELQDLQVQQWAERDRFLDYQRKCLADMRTEYEQSRKQTLEAQTAFIRETRTEVYETYSSPLVPLLICPPPFTGRKIPLRLRIAPTRSRNEADGRTGIRETHLRHPPPPHGSLLPQRLLSTPNPTLRPQFSRLLRHRYRRRRHHPAPPQSPLSQSNRKRL